MASGHFVINAANRYDLAAPNSDATTGTWAIMLVSSSFVGTITVKAKIGPSQAWNSDTITPVAWSYLSYYLNGAANAGVQATGITGTSLILVPASGLRISLDTTSAYTSGTMDVYALPLEGAAA